MHLVLFWPALLAVVLVRTLRFVKNANAASMLPYAAAIALNEQPAGVVGLRDVRYGYDGDNHVAPTADKYLPKDESNPYFTYDPSKCIVCNRCVRACEEVQGTFALTLASRGYAPRHALQAAAVGRAASVLFLRTHARAERVHMAMLARGFSGSMPRAEALRFGRADAAFAVLIVLALVPARVVVEGAA